MTSHPALLLPLCSSSASLALSTFQYPLLFAFLPKASPTTSSKSTQSSPATHRLSGRPFSHWWASFLVPGTGIIAGCVLTSVVAGAFSGRWLQQHRTLETTLISQWYTYGTVAAIGHFAFLPAVAPILKRIIERKEEDREENKVVAENERDARVWLTWHTVRTLTVDLAAVICFAKGIALSMWVV